MIARLSANTPPVARRRRLDRDPRDPRSGRSRRGTAAGSRRRRRRGVVEDGEADPGPPEREEQPERDPRALRLRAPRPSGARAARPPARTRGRDRARPTRPACPLAARLRRAAVEVALLGEARGECGGGRTRRCCRRVAGHLEEVRADGVGRWWGPSRMLEQAVDDVSPAAVRSNPTATARLSRTVGSARPVRACRRGDDLRPVGPAAPAASVCTAAIAACSWNRPTGPRGSTRSSSATPSAISSRSHRLRSCSASGTRSPARRSGRRCALVSSISASAPATSSWSGSARCSGGSAGSPRRSACVARQRLAGAAGVALVEHEVQHVEHRRHPLGELGGRGRTEARAGAAPESPSPGSPVGRSWPRARGTRRRSRPWSGRRPPAT